MPNALQRRLDRLVSRQEARISNAFKAFLADVRSDQTLREIADLLGRRNIEGALAIVDSYVVRMGPTITQIFQDVARDETAQATPLLGTLSRAAITFDPTDRQTAELMRSNQLRFVREFSQEQRRATQFVLGRAYMQGASIQQAVRSLRNSIGLTESQTRAVTRYEDLLRAQSAEALSRTLRDRRYDAAVRRAASGGEPLSERQVEVLVNRYHQRYLAYRAETIARTEGVRTTSIARREALRQALDDANINPNQIMRIWNTTQDDRTRDSHAAMDGQEVGMNEPFESGAGNMLMFPGDPRAPAEEVINCRCVVTTRLKDAA